MCVCVCMCVGVYVRVCVVVCCSTSEAPPLQVYLPMVKQGFKALTQGLLSDTFLEAHVS